MFLLQLAVVVLVLGQPSVAGHIFLLGLAAALISPWFWVTILGASSLTKGD